MNSFDDRGSCNRLFVALAALYLLLPSLIFLLTWIRPSIGLPAAALCVYGYVQLLRGTEVGSGAWRLSLRTVVLLALLSLAWAFLSGAGGVLPQSEDYQKHNLIYKALAQTSGVVTYGAGADLSFLCYGLGYYLVPGIVAQWFGESWINPVSFVWLSAGLFLCFWWLASCQPRRPIVTVLIFLGTAGVLGAWLIFKWPTVINIGGISVPGFGLDMHLRVMGIANSNYDPFTRVHFQPQHAIAGWVGAALLYELIWVQKRAETTLFVWATTFLWSPFTSIALFIIPLLSLRQRGVLAYVRPTNVFSGGVLLGIIALYYAAHEPLKDRGPIWSLSPDSTWVIFYLLFLLTQVVPLVLCVYLIDRKYRVLEGIRTLFGGMALFLVLLPIYKVGFHGDLRMQASGPAMVFVSLGAAACFYSPAFSLRKPLFLAFTAVFALGALYPITRPFLNALTNRADYTVETAARTGGPVTLPEIRDHRFDSATQYLGRTDSFAYRRLLRSTEP